MKRIVLAAVLFGSTLSFADGFRYERPVTPGGKGPNRLALDAPVLTGAAPVADYGKGTSGLDDLRLFDAAGKEMPYLLVSPAKEEPAWRAGRVLPVARTKKTSGFEADLGTASRVDRVRVSGLPAPFLKRCRLEGSGDRSHYVLLVGEGTLFDLPDESLVEHDLSFPPGDYRYLRVTWDDTSSGLVPLPRKVEARLAGTAPAPRASLALPFEKRESEPKTSRYRIRLPGPHLPLAAVRLRVDAGHVFREARVTEPRLSIESGSEVKPVTLGTATLRRSEREGAVAADLRIPIALPQGSELDLVVQDGDNPPLAIAGLEGELVPLPFVYFESPDGAPLLARFGNPTLKAPRYDVEAAREEAASGRGAEAKWGDRKELEPVAAAATGGAAVMTGAAIEKKDFRYSRAIAGLAAGLDAVRLDVPVLAHSATLSDLRIATEDGAQIPYLLERQEEPLVLALGPVKADAKGSTPGRTRYEWALPFDSLPEARLVLSTSSRLFERHLSLTAKRSGAEGDSEAPPAPPSVATWRHTLADVPAADLSLDVPARVARLVLEVDEGDNAPLPISAAKLLLPSYRLRFYGAANAAWSLLYGAPTLGSPRYDLSLEAPRLVGLAAHEAALGPEGAPKAAPAARADLVFWGVLVAAVLILLALLARLLRGASSPEDGVASKP